MCSQACPSDTGTSSLLLVVSPSLGSHWLRGEIDEAYDGLQHRGHVAHCHSENRECLAVSGCGLNVNRWSSLAKVSNDCSEEEIDFCEDGFQQTCQHVQLSL